MIRHQRETKEPRRGAGLLTLLASPVGASPRLGLAPALIMDPRRVAPVVFDGSVIGFENIGAIQRSQAIFVSQVRVGGGWWPPPEGTSHCSGDASGSRTHSAHHRLTQGCKPAALPFCHRVTVRPDYRRPYQKRESFPRVVPRFRVEPGAGCPGL